MLSLGGKEPNTVPVPIVLLLLPRVNSQRQLGEHRKVFQIMARRRKQRRQQHGSAWHWKQTDCWYYTEPGTRKRVALFDEDGEMLIEATSDHVRSGLRGLFARGYTVGAIPVGYRRKEIPEAPLTNRGAATSTPASCFNRSASAAAMSSVKLWLSIVSACNGVVVAARLGAENAQSG